MPNRKQRIKNENIYSIWLEILFGVSQGKYQDHSYSFHIILADLFFIISEIDISTYSDDTHIYAIYCC